MREWVNNAKKAMPGRNWIMHIILWLVCVGLFVEILQSDSKNASLLLYPIVTLSFGLHELAHVVTGFLPDVMTAAAGSLSELLFAATLVFIAYRKRAYITAHILTLWYMFASLSAGRYMADARSQLLPLVSIASATGGDGEATHDWHFVFSKLGILNTDVFIGTIVKGVGVIFAVIGLSMYAYFICLMRSKSARESVVSAGPAPDDSPTATIAYSNDPKEYRK
jgi:hypothetical protein